MNRGLNRDSVTGALEKLFLRSTHCLSQYYHHVCHLQIPKQMFLKSLHIFPPILAAMFFPIIHLVMTCFLFKCSKNVLELLRTFLELAGSMKVLIKLNFLLLILPFFSFFLYILLDPRLRVLSASVLCALQVAG